MSLAKMKNSIIAWKMPAVELVICTVVCATCPPTYDEELFERLRAWRSSVAADAKVPAYVVFTDATLVAIAEALPPDLGRLARIPGVGPAKLERYGDQVLELLASG